MAWGAVCQNFWRWFVVQRVQDRPPVGEVTSRDLAAHDPVGQWGNAQRLAKQAFQPNSLRALKKLVFCSHSTQPPTNGPQTYTSQ